ncbi:MAG: ribosome small subunit-dependent GTPase A, partial [Candidatus Cloacimonetes bacterium]|nr:ribosome small subunit-dependent GTPase A [Candidatus Cloacimonadota bacterium]
SMYKKKDKKLITHSKVNIKNEVLGDIYDYEHLTHQSQTRGIKKHQDKNVSRKSGLNLKRGVIIEIQSNHLCLVELEDGIVYPCIVGGRLKQYNFTTHALVVVGDIVQVDISQENSYRIEEIEPRKSTFSRYLEGSFQTEIPIATNVDLVVITTSWAYPLIKYGLIDRYLCLAAKYEITPLICLNKIDMALDRAFVEEDFTYYRESGIDIVFTSCETGEGIEELRGKLKGKVSVFSGQSGVGKSSLINLLYPGVNLKTAEVSESNEKGRHTTTSSRLIKWGFGGYLVDTPGIKTVTLHSSDKQDIPKIFPGFSRFSDGCNFRDCTHTHEEICGIKQAVEDCLIPLERYESFIRLMESL